MAGLIEKVKGGYEVDGFKLCSSNCGCGGLTGAGGYGVGDCCMTFSRVKHDGDTIKFLGKRTTPNTTNNYEWGYKVKKDGTVVDVTMLDTKGPVNFEFGGVEPPPLNAWTQRGWQVVDQFERPIKGTGEPLPEWCDSAESACLRPEIEIESPKGDVKRSA